MNKRFNLKSRISFVILFAAVFTLSLPGQTMAVDVVMNFNSLLSDHPAYDSDCSKLIAMMSAVETRYQAIFEDAGTLNVNFMYDDLGEDTLATTLVTGWSNGHPTSCTIWVGTDVNWYFDPTPTNNSEYNMVQTLAGSVSNPGSRYDGTVPDLLEYSYKGDTNGSVAAASGTDLWSVMIHEMGHGMGMNIFTAWSEVYLDDDYDFDPDFVWGNTMAADCYSGDGYHLAAATSMYPTIPPGRRKSLSATDIFAIATGGNWSDSVDLFRQDFYSTGINANLNSAALWEGNKVPDSNDDVWFRHGGSARPHTANVTYNNVFVGANSILRTSNFRVRADQDCVVGNGDSDTGTIHVQTGGEFQVDGKLTVYGGSAIIMDDNSTLLDVGNLQLNSNSSLTGAGTIDISNRLHNNGTITTSGGTLTINSTVDVDLDGDNVGTIHVANGNLVCNAALTDVYSTTLQIDDGYSFTMNADWRMSSISTLNVNTNGYIYGGDFRVGGTVNIVGDVNIYSNIQIDSTATVNLNGGSGDDLYLRGDVIVNAGATFNGTGEFWTVPDKTCVFDDGAEIGLYGKLRGTIVVEEDGIGEVGFTRNCVMHSSDPTFVMEADGDESCDLFDVDGTLTFDGTLDLDFIDSYVPDEGDSFTLFTYNAYSGSFDTITWDGAFDLVPNYGATAFTLTVSYGDDMGTEAVPEPSTLILLLGAGCGLIFLKKRRFDK